MQYHKKRTDNIYQLRRISAAETCGVFNMPIIDQQHCTPERVMPFNVAISQTSRRNDGVGIHFFIDDYEFERIWKYPERPISKLMLFGCVFTPDFSLYMDMPIALQIYNTYRNRAIGRIWQNAGLKVIPTVSWSGPESYKFCFDGVPRNGTVAISTIGAKKNKTLWENGAKKMKEILSPKTVLIYGPHTDFDFGCEKVFYKNNNFHYKEH